MTASQTPGTRAISSGRFWRGLARVSPLAVAVATVASLLVMILPGRTVAGEAMPTYVPITASADAHRSRTGLGLDAPFTVQFSKPMNPPSVESAVAVSPEVPLRFAWDASSQILSILPAGHWEPYTNYSVDITSAATDQEGLSLGTEIHTAFQSGSPTAGTLSATLMAGGLAGPNTAFQLTFDHPVKLSTVATRLSISPAVQVTISGDDPTDTASQVFTMAPKTALEGLTKYTVTLADQGTDSSGAVLQHVDPLSVTTMAGPAVLSFTPQNGSYTTDVNQNISIRFSTAMDHESTQAAFSLTVNGVAAPGTFGWTENDTVMVFNPRSAFRVGAKVVATLTATARSITGMHLDKASSSSFTVRARTTRPIAYTGGISTSTSPWYGSELYYLALMNCTRTGGWVTSTGDCSSITHHTLPAQNRLALSAAISNKVARPYAQYMADNRILDHYAYHTPYWRLCNWGGFCGGSYGENIASPPSVGANGMVRIETFYQNEYWQACPTHYCNIMNPHFRVAGIGVWVSSTTRNVRVVIDFNG
jgi:hypothetical protein